ncbi:MAG: hypothetical protein Q8K55_03645 [Gemmatimonadaceae bacterium]|nr:hypothetical protein [Gemmatimonadaceae bacterium]
MKNAFLILCGTIVSLAACAGNVRMSRLQVDEFDKGKEVRGLIVYQPMLVELTYSYTARVDETGKVLGTSAKQGCLETMLKQEVYLLADLEKPTLIRNASGLFSAAKFNVTLNDGMLTSVNAEPTQKLSDVLTATSSLVSELGVLAKRADQRREEVDLVRILGDTGFVCNAAPALTSSKRISVKP